RGAFGEAATERLARRCDDPVNELLLVAAPRHREQYSLSTERQGLRHELLFDQLMTEQYERRLSPVVVELADKRGQHFLDCELAVVAREIRAIAPVLAAAKEENLDAGLPSGLMGCSDLRI